MRVRIQKSGNSLGLRIPRAYAREARLEIAAALVLHQLRFHIIVVCWRGPNLDDEGQGNLIGFQHARGRSGGSRFMGATNRSGMK